MHDYYRHARRGCCCSIATAWCRQRECVELDGNTQVFGCSVVFSIGVDVDAEVEVGRAFGVIQDHGIRYQIGRITRRGILYTDSFSYSSIRGDQHS